MDPWILYLLGNALYRVKYKGYTLCQNLFTKEPKEFGEFQANAKESSGTNHV